MNRVHCKQSWVGTEFSALQTMKEALGWKGKCDKVISE